MDLILAQPLSDEELIKLTFLESVIDRGQYQFLAVGDALRQIKEEKLWRHTHRSFEEYCSDRWQFSGSYARRLLRAKDVIDALPPQAEIVPETERQARALLAVPEEKRTEVWQEAVKKGGGDPIRASRLVAEVFRQMTAEEQELIKKQARISTAGLRQSASNEWYTPMHYLVTVREMWGEIDLDPASCDHAQGFVQANRYFTQKENGLTIDWVANSVFCNPPYGKLEKQGSVVKYWVDKALGEHKKGNAKEVILLLNAFTSSGWFQPLWDHTICFVNRRIHFVSPTAAGATQPAHGSVFVYIGPNHERFALLFKQHGTVVRRYKPEEF